MNHALIESMQTLESVAIDIDAAPQTRMQLENLQSSIENKQFYLPVVGQFSAGKSHFINNLLGRDILPTLTTETTSFLTTIRFGEQDKLLIKLNNNQELVLDISMAKCLSQQSISRGELSIQLPELNIDDISSLDIELNSPLLEDGLVLVDTPGINTLHSAHEAMTYEFLIDSMKWREMHDFSDDCVLIVLASSIYEEADYIRDYEDFLCLINK